MTSGRRETGRAGQPLLALALMLFCWVALRAALFELPREMLPEPAARVRDFIRSAGSLNRALPSMSAVPDVARAVSRFPDGPRATAPARPWRTAALGFPTPRSALVDPGVQLAPVRPLSQRLAAGHNLLWMAAMQAIPLPVELVSFAEGTAPLARGSSRSGMSGARWSADIWLALRQGAGSLAPGGAVALVYGGSQGGAILRYSLAPSGRHRPAVYIRAVGALDTRESDLAAGLSARPFAALPVSAQVEARLSRRGGSVDLRPAAFLTAGVDALRLPAGFHARGYAQGGYVGGRDATAFADGSLVAERRLLRDGGSELAAGAGMWGGGQRGAARLDLGPSASLRFRLGEGTGRLALDYRLRVAGNAAPAAGAALTLSAGF